MRQSIQILTGIPFILGVSSLATIANAQMSLTETFHCDAVDMTYSISMNATSMGTAIVAVTVGERMDQSLTRTPTKV